MKAISLFSSSGIGDLGLHNNNIETIINGELLEKRAMLFKENHNKSRGFIGDIWETKDDIISFYKEKYGDEELFVLMATPPCQGMSPSGRGTLMKAFREGKRPELDERNRLIIPTIEVILALKPKWVILENVPQMKNTMIEDEEGRLVNILDFIHSKLTPLYVGSAEVVDTADFGLAQNRKRLMTVYGRSKKAKIHFEKEGTFIPKRTHSEYGMNGTKKWVTVGQALKGMLELEGVEGLNTAPEQHPLHRVPILNKNHLQWTRNTPMNESALNNQCNNPACLSDNNPKYNRAALSDPDYRTNCIYCVDCGSLLPRPFVLNKKTNELHAIRAFKTSYKRMNLAKPSYTLTTNFQNPSSSNTLHPIENRVLSLYEGMILQGISLYDYQFKIDGEPASDRLIRESIGESVSPVVIDKIAENIIEIG